MFRIAFRAAFREAFREAFPEAVRWSLLACACVLLLSPAANAHCQMPCGIYDDPARIAQLREDATTIAKAITEMTTLAGKQDVQSLNQLTRWVNTKEEAASHIIEVVSDYFLTQKVKPVAAGAEGRDAYLQMLADHHAVMRAAMLTKQQANAAAVTDLQQTIEKLAQHYQQH